MNAAIRFSLVFATLLILSCGEEYYSTPQKTLAHYVENRMMGSSAEEQACLNAFKKADKEWYESHYEALCWAAYGRDCPGPGVTSEATVWVDMFEPAGPKTTDVDSADVKEKTATLVVQGKEIHFIKERGNWKIDGLFGIDTVKEKYPQVK